MEEIIRDIVDADKAARISVQEKKRERHDIQSLIQSQKLAIKNKYQEETDKCINSKRDEMDNELAMQVKREELAFEEALTNLDKQYEEHKEEWIKQIVNRCLAS